MAYVDEVLADSPVVYYRLGEASGTTMVDSSGNGRDGTYVASPDLGSPGLIHDDPNTAIWFDSVNQSGVIPYESWMNNTAVSYEFWYKPDAASRFQRRYILSRYASSSIDQDVLVYLRVGRIHFNMYTGSGTTGEISAPTFAADQIYHIVFTRDGTTARLYVDGIEAVSTTYSGNRVGTADLRIGYPNLTPDAPYVGVLDEFAAYDYALTPGRIRRHYLAGIAPRPTPETYRDLVVAGDPVIYYRLGETSGNAQNEMPASYPASWGSEVGRGPGLLVDDPNGAAVWTAGPTSSQTTISRYYESHVMDRPSVTVEAWIKPESVGDPFFSNVIASRYSFAGGAAARSWYLAQHELGIRAGVSVNGTDTEHSLVVPGVLEVGTTYHVVMTYDQDEMRIYLDGVEIDSLEVGGPLNGGNQALRIGMFSGTDSLYKFVGTIDEFAFYGYALSAEEIAAHYALGTGSAPDAPIEVGVAIETDTALPAEVTAETLVQAGVAVETDTAFSAIITTDTRFQTGVASEADTPLAISIEVDTTLSAGLSAETDSAIPVSISEGSLVSIGVAVEIDSALTVAVEGDVGIAVGVAVESDSALPVIMEGNIEIPVGVAIETDSALAAHTGENIGTPVGVAAETDVAIAATIHVPSDPVEVPVGMAVENDSTFPASLINSGPQYVSLEVAIENNVARRVTVVGEPLTLSLGVAVETDTARPATFRDSSATETVTPTDRLREGIGYATWDPPVVEPPDGIVYDYIAVHAYTGITFEGE